ncbi:hypothetical protein MAR_003850 [Mya arenaria]|uniref:Uncharacterized protein n=1 Tax=Mya arenaria TaxID=6604 RepID=A0ABY7EUW7_MYAAR|nr:hypothetical protein MAR_003850 [Mya arenaria]
MLPSALGLIVRIETARETQEEMKCLYDNPHTRQRRFQLRPEYVASRNVLVNDSGVLNVSTKKEIEVAKYIDKMTTLNPTEFWKWKNDFYNLYSCNDHSEFVAAHYDRAKTNHTSQFFTSFKCDNLERILNNVQAEKGTIL